jgi:hypothetical protein
VDDSGFEQLIDAAASSDEGADALTDLAQRYSYVFPDDRTLAALGGLGPIVEIGAGTGYWAYRLRNLGVDVLAFDQAPPDQQRSNRYHAPTSTWSGVIAGDESVLRHHAGRALFLCWPPLFSSLGECLTYYAGETVALIGDGGHRTARLRGLNEAFTLVALSPVRALEPFPGVAPALGVWRRSTMR